MYDSRVLRTILLLSGLVAIAIGGAILLAPEAFYAPNGVAVGGSISSLNEMRAPGGALLASGVLIMLGGFVPSLTFTSIVVSTVLYLSYGLARVLSMAIDGLPSAGIVAAAVVELLLGLAGAFALQRYRTSPAVG